MRRSALGKKLFFTLLVLVPIALNRLPEGQLFRTLWGFGTILCRRGSFSTIVETFCGCLASPSSDSPPHVPPGELSTDTVIQVMANMTQTIRRNFPDLTVYPALGNHDYWPQVRPSVVRRALRDAAAGVILLSCRTRRPPPPTPSTEPLPSCGDPGCSLALCSRSPKVGVSISPSARRCGCLPPSADVCFLQAASTPSRRGPVCGWSV